VCACAQALKNYTKAMKLWDGEEEDLAQVRNAMGFCYLNMEKLGSAAKEFEEAGRLQPGYVTAWNNLADVREKEGKWKEALVAYERAYQLDPANPTASSAVERLRVRSKRMASTM
jgi:tetratricopeptide (TPR) repeat protein